MGLSYYLDLIFILIILYFIGSEYYKPSPIAEFLVKHIWWVFGFYLLGFIGSVGEAVSGLVYSVVFLYYLDNYKKVNGLW